MNAETRTRAVFLLARLDGRPIDACALLAAIWDGAITDLERVEMDLSDRPFLSQDDISVPEELQGYAPVSSVSSRREDR